ncbi:MAG TPA: Ku protein [Thermoanaerobaculia bacterium]|nr:Ku protein [Thermoanaerobaculia bacterium]
MAQRPTGTATISFGLVSIPVNLYSASESKAAISFNMLHDEDHARVKQQLVCSKDGATVERDHIVKGYEFEKGQYVVFTPEELKALEEQSNQIMEITEFVPLAKIDPVYFDKGYYLSPGKGGDKAYRLLAKAMTETGRCGLAKYAARGKQYLVVVRPVTGHEGGLMMQQLNYADEIRSFADVEVPDAEVKDAELKLAIMLTDQIASDEFHPENYKDEVKERVEALIKRKIDGQEISEAKPEAPKTQVIDLMEALKASLAARGGRGGRQKEAASAPAKPERKPAVRAAREEQAEKPRLRAVGNGKKGR